MFVNNFILYKTSFTVLLGLMSAN